MQQCGHQIWRNETKVFRDKEYQYVLESNVKGDRHIHLNYCPIVLPVGLDIQDNTVFVKIEICPSGQRHLEAYATSATDKDPTSRLAFRMRFKTSTGSDIRYYEHNAHISPLFRENSFVKILADELPNEIIAKRPRRYLCLKNPPPSLEAFKGGKYTTPPHPISRLP